MMSRLRSPKVLAAAAAGALVGVLAASLAALGPTPALADDDPAATGNDPPPADGAPAVDSAPDSDSPFFNVEVLTHVRTKAEMRAIMRDQSAALGVKCSHCHVAGHPERDDKEAKLVARDMLRLVAGLESGPLAGTKEKPSVTCWTCHRGSLEPETKIPRAAFDALDAMK